jgi:thiamine pyrophosphate-dependent enzyme
MSQAPEQPTDPSADLATDPSGGHHTEQSEPVEAHSGQHAVAVAREHGVEVMFTLSGAHVFPMYDGAVTADPPMRIVDVRHEQTAAFAAEAMGKLTRKPGLAVLTAGPGVTNGISAIAQAQFSGSPLVVVGGRAPANRWGTGSLQELDQPPIVAPVSKLARTIHKADEVADGMHEAFTVAGTHIADRSSSTSRWTSSSTPPPQPVRSSAIGCARSPTATRSLTSPSCSARRSDPSS